MDPEAMEPFGKALLEYTQGNKSATAAMIRDDGHTDMMSIDSFFRTADAFDLERVALSLCKGRILDVGAGTGLHTLSLQDRGFQVTAIDINPEAIQIMKDRGVSDARQADVMNFGGEQFDTIIMMGHGIGMVEDIAGLDRSLERVDGLLNPAGQILLTSIDIRESKEPGSVAYQQRNLNSGRYVGEIRLQIRFGEWAGPWFGWLHVDPETLEGHSSRCGLVCHVVSSQADGNYLAQLVRKPG